MEVPTTIAVLNKTPLPLSLFDLPPEIRNKIYKYVYEEVTIDCTPGVELDQLIVRKRRSSKKRVTPDLSLLLASQQAYVEAKSYLDSASIRVTGSFREEATPLNFPQNVMQRVHELILPANICFMLQESMKLYGLRFFDRNIFPNLRVISLPAVDPLYRASTAIEDSLLRYIALTLPILGASSEADNEMNLDAPNLLDLVLTDKLDLVSQSRRGPPVSQYSRNLAKGTDMLIKSGTLVVKMSYKFIVRGYDFEEQSRAGLGSPPPFFEDQVEVTVTWDKNGMRTQVMPDLVSKMPWKIVPGNKRHHIVQGQRRVNHFFYDGADDLFADDQNYPLFRISW